MKNKENIMKFIEKYNLPFSDLNVIYRAFSHTSYANEVKDDGVKSYERLEFLGDAVLEMSITEFLFKNYPTMSEGDLTKMRASIVCEPSLFNYATKLNFGDKLFLGKGEEQSGGRTREAILADVFESVLAAIYLEFGYSKVYEFLELTIFPDILAGKFTRTTDYKSKLQELIQGDKRKSVTYKIAHESGPAHDKTFVAEAYIEDEIRLGTGTGTSKKEAEQLAAKMALDKLAHEK